MNRRPTVRRIVHKPIALLAALLSGALLLASCSDDNSGGGGDAITLNVASTQPTESPFDAELRRVGEAIEERTEGRVKLKVFPDSQLGSNEEAIDQFLTGAPTVGHFNASGAATLGKVPEFAAVGFPYVVEDPADIGNLVESDLYQEWASQLEENGFVVLGGNWYFGTRHIVSTSPEGYPAPDDMAGVKIRIPEGQQFLALFQPLAQPVVLDPAETYTGMDQGTVDAAEGPLQQTVDWALDELGKSITLTGHIKEVTGLAMGATTWQQLSEEDREVVREEFQAGGERFSEQVLENEEKVRAEMESAGITFVEADVAAYQAVAESAMQDSDYTSEWPDDLVANIKDALGSGS